MTAAEREEILGLLGARARAMSERRRRGPATRAGMSKTCPRGVGILLSDPRLIGTAPVYQLFCPGDPDYGRAVALEAGARRRRGMGDAASDLRALPLPGSLERYLATGAPMPSYKRDLGAATAQIPRWGYGLGAVLAILLGAKAYTRWRDAR